MGVPGPHGGAAPATSKSQPPPPGSRWGGRGYGNSQVWPRLRPPEMECAAVGAAVAAVTKLLSPPPLPVVSERVCASVRASV